MSVTEQVEIDGVQINWPSGSTDYNTELGLFYFVNGEEVLVQNCEGELIKSLYTAEDIKTRPEMVHRFNISDQQGFINAAYETGAHLKGSFGDMVQALYESGMFELKQENPNQ